MQEVQCVSHHGLSFLIISNTIKMEAKDQFVKTDHAKIYSCYRRPTPKLLIEKIISVLKEKYQGSLDFALDVGCGSGQSTVALAPFFQKVHGMDVSEAQIQQAKESRLVPNVSYTVSPAEVLAFDDGSVQLVTAAAAIHWFQMDEFFPEVRRVLCNNGILAVYCYCSMKPLVENQPALLEEVDKLWTEFYKLTSSYHAPQAKIAMTAYKDIDFPFEEVQRFDSVRDIFEGRVDDIIGYASTFSGFQNLRRENKKKADEFLCYFEQRMKEIITKATLDVDGTLQLYRDFCLILCRKITNG